MKRQVIVTDWKRGVSRSAYVDLGPGRAELHQTALLTRKLAHGAMSRSTAPPASGEREERN